MSEKIFIIGLTGGILSGKSTVARMLVEKGAGHIDADKMGHEAYEPHTKTWQKVVDAFGTGILKDSEEIDRQKLGDIVFNDPESLARLNRIVHPQIGRLVVEELEKLRSKGVDVVVIEAILLIEARWTNIVDEVWVTVALEETVLKRLQNRSGLSEEQARARIRAQLSSEERAKYGDVVINTDCDLSEVRATVDELWQRLQSRKERS
ncbi:MAG: dephospho-CoA kinase [Dehalococcoidia bacterium]